MRRKSGFKINWKEVVKSRENRGKKREGKYDKRGKKKKRGDKC